MMIFNCLILLVASDKKMAFLVYSLVLFLFKKKLLMPLDFLQ